MLQYFHLSTIYDKYRPISTDKTKRIWKAQTFPRTLPKSGRQLGVPKLPAVLLRRPAPKADLEMRRTLGLESGSPEGRGDCSHFRVTYYVSLTVASVKNVPNDTWLVAALGGSSLGA